MDAGIAGVLPRVRLLHRHCHQQERGEKDLTLEQKAAEPASQASSPIAEQPVICVDDPHVTLKVRRNRESSPLHINGHAASTDRSSGATLPPDLKKDGNQASILPATSDVGYVSATADEKRDWKGFCEIESEPAILNQLMRDLGATGLELKELYAVDEETVEGLGRDVHGFLFLFQVGDEDLPSGDDAEVGPPDDLWFANQVSANSCATVALVNLLLNYVNANTSDEGHTMIGPLENIRSSTVSCNALQKGKAIMKHCGQAHNKYARKMDMLEQDLALEKRYNSASKKRKKVGNARKSKPRRKPDYTDEAIHHYIAFVWDQRSGIWSLDGTHRRPTKAAEYTSSEGLPTATLHQPPQADQDSKWWQPVLPVILTRMSDLQDGGISFNLLALVDSDSNVLKKQLSRLEAEVACCEERAQPRLWITESTNPSGQSKQNANTARCNPGHCHCDDESMETTGNAGEHSPSSKGDVGDDSQSSPRANGALNGSLCACLSEKPGSIDHGYTSSRLAKLLSDIENAEVEESQQAHYALEKQQEFGPFINTWLGMLAENGELERQLTIRP